MSRAGLLEVPPQIAPPSVIGSEYGFGSEPQPNMANTVGVEAASEAYGYHETTQEAPAEVNIPAYSDVAQWNAGKPQRPRGYGGARRAQAGQPSSAELAAGAGYHGQHHLTIAKRAERVAGSGPVSAARKARDWLTYSDEEWDAKQAASQAGKHRAGKHVYAPQHVRHAEQPEMLREGGVVPQHEDFADTSAPSAQEVRHSRLLGALNEAEYQSGRAQMEHAQPATGADKDEVLVELVRRGARNEGEVFNEMYAHSTAGGSAIYGGRIRGQRVDFQTNAGPVEHNIARGYARELAIVSQIEAQVTDKFAPSTEVVEAMLYPDSADRELTTGEKEVVSAVYDRVLQLRRKKMPAGEELHMPVAATDYTGPTRHRWHSLQEQAAQFAIDVKRFTGRAALHGAAWAAAVRTSMDFSGKPIEQERMHVPLHAATPDIEGANLYEAYSVDNPLKIYTPGELAAMASRWAFVKAQMIAKGTLQMSTDFFVPRNPETSSRRPALLRMAGAAATLATAAASAYVFYKAGGLAPPKAAVPYEMTFNTHSQN